MSIFDDMRQNIGALVTAQGIDRAVIVVDTVQKLSLLEKHVAEIEQKLRDQTEAEQTEDGETVAGRTYKYGEVSGK